MESNAKLIPLIGLFEACERYKRVSPPPFGYRYRYFTPASDPDSYRGLRFGAAPIYVFGFMQVNKQLLSNILANTSYE